MIVFVVWVRTMTKKFFDSLAFSFAVERRIAQWSVSKFVSCLKVGPRLNQNRYNLRPLILGSKVESRI